MTNQEIASKVARYLLQINAVKLNPANPFQWSSGWMSPIYCDNRVTLSYPEIRNFLKTSFAQRLKEEFPEANCLVGVATAGIALGALVAEALNLPYAYCRPKPKEHGMKNQLEGRIEADAKIVVVEDLISTGGSSLKVVEYLRNEGYRVDGLGAIFTYGFSEAEQRFTEASCPYYCLSNYLVLIQEAIEMNYVEKDALRSLDAWRNDPEHWGT